MKFSSEVFACVLVMVRNKKSGFPAQNRKNSVKLAVICRRVKGTQQSDISVQLCNVPHCKNKLNLTLKGKTAQQVGYRSHRNERQSKTLLKIDERGSKIARNSVFYLFIYFFCFTNVRRYYQ